MPTLYVLRTCIRNLDSGQLRCQAVRALSFCPQLLYLYPQIPKEVVLPYYYCFYLACQLSFTNPRWPQSLQWENGTLTGPGPNGHSRAKPTVSEPAGADRAASYERRQRKVVLLHWKATTGPGAPGTPGTPGTTATWGRMKRPGRRRPCIASGSSPHYPIPLSRNQLPEHGFSLLAARVHSTKQIHLHGTGRYQALEGLSSVERGKKPCQS